MLRENHFNGMDREESLDSNLAGRPDSASSNNFENDDENLHQNRRDNSSGINAEYGQNSIGSNSHAEMNRLSSELNSRISREKDAMMNSVSDDVNDAIKNLVLPQTRNAIMAGSRHVTRRGWNVSAEEPEVNFEVLRNAGTRDNSRSEHTYNCHNDEQPNHNAYDNHKVSKNTGHKLEKHNFVRYPPVFPHHQFFENQLKYYNKKE